jgi:hypothetical protein
MRQEWPPALTGSDLTYLPLPSFLLASDQEPMVIVTLPKHGDGTADMAVRSLERPDERFLPPVPRSPPYS